MDFNIKEMVKDNKKVRFICYKQGVMIYTTECGFTFPVPIDDTGDGTFLAEDKSLLYMRYIRKHIKYIQDAKNKSEDGDE